MIIAVFVSGLGVNLHAQQPFQADTVKASLFDNGKMWTFELPPVDYFEETYELDVTPEWLEAVRMSALRFANWCSASFVSADGLVMTNHHCSRDVATRVEKAGEDLLNKGFYATSLQEERRIPDLFVDQLVMIEDITERVQREFDKGSSDQEKLALRAAEFERIKTEYAEREGWKDLVIQPVTLYQGARYSLYGFRRFTDVRLVLIPEMAVGYFGGDYDNFTYPRYCLDFTFFRVYDDDGKPFKPKYYYKFNPDGVKDNEPVFVVGNPGRTNRQATVAMLEYYRDVSLPAILDLVGSRSKILHAYNEKAQSDSIMNLAFGWDNTLKAYGGQLDGLRDPYIMARRTAFEKQFRTTIASKGKYPETGIQSPLKIWDEIAEAQTEVGDIYYETLLFSPPQLFNSRTFDLAFSLNRYALLSGSKEAAAEAIRKSVTQDYVFTPEVEKGYLEAHLREAERYFGGRDAYVMAASEYGNADVAAATLLKNTKVQDLKFRNDLLTKGPKSIERSKDPMIQLTRIAAQRYTKAEARMEQVNARLAGLRARLSLLLYDAYGSVIPPDATFSLRLADGVVKSYDYNGTKAPLSTTFYGMYDRFHSFDGKFPWELPERWKNPSPEFLRQPVNFISTNDITGGNSGSPVINRNREVVGLAFDGNMESLPGSYIYMPERNRTVSVHVGGIVASLKYIYEADRLIEELKR